MQKVTIGLPVYNGARYLCRALDSLLNQTHSDLELIICDNASTDGTAQICEWYAGRDERIRYGRVYEHHSAADNFNLTLEKARYPLFMWAAHDDEWAPTFIEECLRRLVDPTVVACYSMYQLFDDSGDIGAALAPKCPHRTKRDRWNYCLTNWPVHAAIYALMRTEDAWATRGLLPFLSADLVFVAELALRGRIVSVPKVLHRKRMRRGEVYEPPWDFHRWHVACELAKAAGESPVLVADVWRAYAWGGLAIDLKSYAVKVRKETTKSVLVCG
jgi:glycosyltransferase involved in cell wall biosynthesis